MSKTVALVPIVGALLEGLKVGNTKTPYSAVNDLQKEFLEKFLKPFQNDLGKFSEEEFSCFSAFTADEINGWLKEKGFNIKLDPFVDPDDFGTASVMDVTVKWQYEGESENLPVVDGCSTYYKDGALVETGVVVTKSAHHEHQIAHIPCKNGDWFHVTIADKEREGFDLLSYVTSLSDGVESKDHNAVLYPMVDLDQEVDIEFFKYMNFDGVGRSGVAGNCRITQAKQQTMFKLNESGAKAKSAAAFGYCFESCVVKNNRPLVIDKPFFAWLTRDGMTFPYFAGYITDEDWKRPESF